MSRPRSLSRGWLFLFPAVLPAAHPLAMAGPLRCNQDLVCRSHLDQAVALERAGKYEPALREFRASYQSKKDPQVAIDIGRTLHRLGRFSEVRSWYTNARRAAPAEIELQKQLQEFTAQAKQNLPEAAGTRSPMSLVNQSPFAVQTSPINLATTSTAINNNIIKLDLCALRSAPRPVYRRVVLWGRWLERSWPRAQGELWRRFGLVRGNPIPKSLPLSSPQVMVGGAK